MLVRIANASLFCLHTNGTFRTILRADPPERPTLRATRQMVVRAVVSVTNERRINVASAYRKLSTSFNAACPERDHARDLRGGRGGGGEEGQEGSSACTARGRYADVINGGRACNRPDFFHSVRIGWDRYRGLHPCRDTGGRTDESSRFRESLARRIAFRLETARARKL